MHPNKPLGTIDLLCNMSFIFGAEWRTTPMSYDFWALGLPKWFPSLPRCLSCKPVVTTSGGAHKAKLHWMMRLTPVPIAMRARVMPVALTRVEASWQWRKTTKLWSCH